MELNDWILILGINIVLSIVFGMLVGYVSMLFRDYRISKLEKEVERIGMMQNSVRGAAARQEKAERTSAAMAEAMAIMNNPEVQDKQKALMALAAKYPDLVGELLKKGL